MRSTASSLLFFGNDAGRSVNFWPCLNPEHIQVSLAPAQVVLRAHPKTCFRRLFQVFSDVMGVNLGHVKFLGSTGRLDADDQLGSLGKGYTVISVLDVPETMSDASMGYVNI